LNLVYGLYGPHGSSPSYATDFHDVTSGFNFAGNAGTGYDLVTGLGSPLASAIIYAAAHPGTAAAPAVVAPQPTVQVARFVVIQQHDVTNSTTDQTTALLTAAEIRFVATALAALPTPPAPLEAPLFFHATGTEIDAAAGPGLPNQSLTASARSASLGSLSLGTTPTVYNGSEITPGEPASPTAVPGRGDFPAPPRLDPSTPIRVWDEALAGIHDEAADGLVEPQAFVPWTACDGVDDHLTESAPSLLGASALAVVFWMSWSRRLAEEDRRTRTFVIPSPSIN
jgi:hypothetical protein